MGLFWPRKESTEEKGRLQKEHKRGGVGGGGGVSPAFFIQAVSSVSSPGGGWQAGGVGEVPF